MFIVCCGPMACWIKMPLGMKVGLGPGDPAPPPERGTATPHFSANFALARSSISAVAEHSFNVLFTCTCEVSIGYTVLQTIYITTPTCSCHNRGDSRRIIYSDTVLTVQATTVFVHGNNFLRYKVSHCDCCCDVMRIIRAVSTKFQLLSHGTR